MEPANSAPPLSDSQRAEVREQLNRILSDAAFSSAARRSRLLRFLVEQALEDRSESLKESVIATEVFDRDAGYDPQIDSVVRVEVGRLRARLADYYKNAVVAEPLCIEIPKGGYRPVFVFRDPGQPGARRPRRFPKWMPVAAGLAVATLVAVAVWRLRSPVPAAPTAIAVLPFLNLSGDPADEYLADGVSEELTETLAESRDLRVVSRTSAFQYKGKNADVREIGRNLRAGAVLEGSIARRGGGLHVVAQLIRSSDGYHLWSHAYETTFAELPPVEASIARASRETLVFPASANVAREVYAPRNPEAHNLYMRAAYELNRRTAESTTRAIALAREATEKDPSFAQPYVAMAAGESQLNTLLAQAPHAGAQRALQDIEKALALDPANSGAHAQKALLVYTDQWDWPRAEKEFQLSLASGSHGSAENLYGWCLITRGRFAEARQRLQAAAELDPLSLGPQLNQVEELMAERNYGEAMSKVQQILRTAPGNYIALALASSIAAYQRDCPAAEARSHDFLKAQPDAFLARINVMAIDFHCGHAAEAQAAFTKLMRNPPLYLSPYALAEMYGAVGDADHALSYLEKSAELREPVLMLLKVDRPFDIIREDPRFVALERKIGLLD